MIYIFRVIYLPQTNIELYSYQLSTSAPLDSLPNVRLQAVAIILP